MALAIDYREVSVEQTSFTHLKNIKDEINEKRLFSANDSFRQYIFVGLAYQLSCVVSFQCHA